MSSTDRITITLDVYLESLLGGFCERTLPPALAFLAGVYAATCAFLAHVCEPFVNLRANLRVARAERQRCDARRRSMLAYQPPHTTSPMPTTLGARDWLPTCTAVDTGTTGLPLPTFDVILTSADSVVESIIVGCGVYDDGTGGTNDGNPPLPLLGVPAVNGEVRPTQRKVKARKDKRTGKRGKSKGKGKATRNVPYSLMGYHELRATCKAQGIPATGTADAMRARLNGAVRAYDVA